MNRKLTIVASLFLAWSLLLKGNLVRLRSTAGVVESLGYLLPDVAAGCLVVALVGALFSGRSKGSYAGGSLVLVIAALWVSLAYSLLVTNGSVLDWPLMFFTIEHLGELSPVIASELGVDRLALLGAPPLFPIIALVLPGAGTGAALSSRRASLRWGGTSLAAWALSFLFVPSPPRHSELGMALLRPIVPIPVRGAANDDPTTLPGILPHPDELREAWKHRPSDAPRPNLMFVVMESVRFSATTPYAPELATTPFLDSLARRSVVFERAYCMVPHTSKSLITIFTGHPPEIRMHSNEAGRLPVPALPKLLGDLGYRSAFFEPATEFFEKRRLLIRDLGFQEYFSGESIGQGHERPSYFGFEDRALVRPVLDWLAKDRSRPFCLGFINLLTHHDYKTPKSFTKRRFAVAAEPPNAEAFQDYLNAIVYFDEVLGELFAELEEGGFLDNTVVFLVGDHGEAFGEHGRQQHDDVPWEEGVRVPLIVHGPRSLVGPPRRVPGLRQLTDLFVTAAELLGVPDQATWRSPALGISLLADSPPDRKLFLSSFYQGGFLAMLQGDHKWIWFPKLNRLERYNLALDPRERADLAAALAPEERNSFVRETRAFRMAVNAWYLMADKAEIERMRVEHPPEPRTRIDAVFDSSLRLVGVTAKDRIGQLDYLDAELVFEVLKNPRPDLELRLDARQSGRRRSVLAVRDLNRLPIRSWRPGDVIVIPQTLLLNEDGPGEVTLELRVLVGGKKPAPAVIAGRPMRDGVVKLLSVRVEPKRDL